MREPKSGRTDQGEGEQAREGEERPLGEGFMIQSAHL
jgi:hypothetical protein